MKFKRRSQQKSKKMERLHRDAVHVDASHMSRLHTLLESIDRPQQQASEKLNEQASTSTAKAKPPPTHFTRPKGTRGVFPEKERPLFNFRSKLPAFLMKDEIIDILGGDNRVCLLSGATGCGKSTQVPQFLIDDAMSRGESCHVIVTQPRRISAIGVAERVAKERGEPLGERVGYQIRLERKLPKEYKNTVTFVTTGVLLRWMQSPDALAERGITHIVIDEVCRLVDLIHAVERVVL